MNTMKRMKSVSKKYAMLVKSDPKNNNNKFYEIILNDDDSVTTRYGRVGASGVTESKGYGETIFEKIKKQKLAPRKGYKEVDVLTSEVENKSKSFTSSLLNIAKRDVTKNNPVLDALIERLTKINKYQLLQASGGAIDIVDGIVKTELGVPISSDSIIKARTKLIELKDYVNKDSLSSEYAECLGEYLTLVPQKVPHRRGWDKSFFSSHTTFVDQNNLLDQIETSIQNYKPSDKSDEVIEEPSKLFHHSLKVVEDGKTFDRVNKFYKSNINSIHSSSHLKLVKIYEIENDDSLTKYKNRLSSIGNEKQLWHGTRAFNVLSILKGGLIIPTSAGGYHITGRMFGDGLYFSDQSSKSLNYAYGYWGGGSRESNCFMFLADVAMGKEYIPPGPLNSIPKGYDSCYAIGGKSGVMNNEMIVYSLDQANLRYLCEFDN